MGSVNSVQRTRGRHGSKESEANHRPPLLSLEVLICTCFLFSFLAYFGGGFKICRVGSILQEKGEIRKASCGFLDIGL